MMSVPELSISILVDEDALQARVDELGGELARRVDDDWSLVALLSGAMPFATDLARALARRRRHPVLDFLWVQSYGDAQSSSGHVVMKADLSRPVEGRRVLLVDDVLDTGASLIFARDHLLKKGAAEVLTCVVAAKPSASITADLVGFTTPDAYLVGYGMDSRGRYRGLPYIGVLSTADQS
jgi:hypoxanthine phosphoribosyltransferase